MASLTVEEWFLLGLLALSIVLVCVAAGDYYGDRPTYPSTMAAEIAEVRHQAEHSRTDRERRTQRLKPPD